MAGYSAVTPRLRKLFLMYKMASNEHSYDEGKDESYYDELMDKETLRLPRTNEALFKEAGRSFISYILRFSHQILLCEKAFRILLRPIREAKRVSHS